MRPHPLLVLLLATATLLAPAQTHKVARPEQVLRAVAVYEWTGDLAKPAASRLIPVSLFIDNHFEDAGVYLARPVPFALETGNVYMLQSAGLDKSSLELSFARHLQATDAAGDSAYDDGWFGYGRVHTLAPPKPPKPLHASKTTPALSSSKPDTAAIDDPDRPTMIRRNPTPQTTPTSNGSGSPASTPGTAGTSSDPDRPTMKRHDSDAANNTPGAPDPAADPDRPTLHRSSGSSTDSSVPPDPSDKTTSTSPAPTSTSTSTSTTNDPDRPTLKHHTPADAAKAATNDLNYNSSALNNDPDRPALHRGRPTASLTETELPRLTGRPVNIRQMVAVSDPANREPHSFTLAFDDAAQHADILNKMKAFAHAQLAAYITPGTPAVSTTQHIAASTAHHPTAKKSTGTNIPLLDEDLKAYQLSYAGDATYIYSAHTDGTGAQLRYVTIVAQMTGLGGGQLQPAIQSVTDALHLDRTPALQFIDAVDADASNRASLLFELRAQNSRQFALYRVIAAHADQIFLTGTTQ